MHDPENASRLPVSTGDELDCTRFCFAEIMMKSEGERAVQAEPSGCTIAEQNDCCHCACGGFRSARQHLDGMRWKQLGHVQCRRLPLFPALVQRWPAFCPIAAARE